MGEKGAQASLIAKSDIVSFALESQARGNVLLGRRIAVDDFQILAQLMSVVVTPYRFRTKRQLRNYSGLGVIMRSSSDWEKTPRFLTFPG